MIVLLSPSFEPALNLALEEYCLNNFDDDFFIIWRNRPVVVIGKNQNVYDEIDFEAAEKLGVSFIRRITGGGAVYHDLGNVNYSFITSADRARVLDFSFFTKPVVEALNSLGVDAGLSGRNDLLVNGAKISGNAQFSTGKRILHHGTLLFSSELEVLSAVLKPQPEKLKSKKIQSVRSRVANISSFLAEKITVEQFISKLEEYICSHFGVSSVLADLNPVINSPFYEKYFSQEYLFGRKVKSGFIKRSRYGFGTLVLCFDVNDKTLQNVFFEGDFFSARDTASLENGLNGTCFDRDNIENRLKELEIGTYFPTLSVKELTDQFFL